MRCQGGMKGLACGLALGLGVMLVGSSAPAQTPPAELQGLPTLPRPVSLPVGSIVSSMLRADVFNGLAEGEWALCDGRVVDAGKLYAVMVTRAPAGTYAPEILSGGVARVPDLRGIFMRGKNNGRGDAMSNPAGEVALGKPQYEALRFHSHEFNRSQEHGDQAGYVLAQTGQKNTGLPRAETNFLNIRTSAGRQSLQSDQDPEANETRPRNATVNYFIRIN